MRPAAAMGSFSTSISYTGYLAGSTVTMAYLTAADAAETACAVRVGAGGEDVAALPMRLGGIE